MSGLAAGFKSQGLAWPLVELARQLCSGELAITVARRSAPRHLPQMLGVTGALHGDVGERGVDLAKIIGVKVDSGSSNVFF